jgi:phospholipid/cholesterol/gamma-HCH transport system substrate-binding protein
MSRFSTAARVGAFAIVMLVASVFIYRFVTKTTGDGRGYTVYCLMKDASGIARQSQVRMAGIPVGHIRSVRLEGGLARIDITIDPDVPLYEDATAARIASSLLGEYHIAIAQGTDGRRRLQDGDRIRVVVEAVTTDQVLHDVAAIAADVKKVSESLAASVGTPRGEENIRITLENLARITENLDKVVKENRETIRTILTNVEGMTARGAPEVQQILRNVNEVTREIRVLLARTEQAEGGAEGADAGAPQQPGELRQIIERANRASQSLERTMANLETVTGRLERGEGTLGRLSRDEQLIDEVEGVAQGVNEYVGGLRRLQTVVGLRVDYQFLSSTVKSYLELRLQPQEDKYYVIEVVNDPRGATRLEQIDVDSTNPNDPPHYREVRTVTTNAFRFSLQFAQTFGPFTGRFGIKESTGGAGLDMHLFDDRFEVVQDLFGFGEVVLPRWRMSIGYEFISRLWLLGGVDDILSSGRRDYFVGLQLRFNDEDLKTVLPFAPSP